MKCPVDGATLMISERNGVEIDYCPDCRGVWLDRGELDKIIDRTSGAQAPVNRGDQTGVARGREGRGKRKESFLSDLFDF